MRRLRQAGAQSAEVELVGAILLDGNCIAEVIGLVEVEDFQDRNLAALFDAALKFFEQDRPLTPQAVIDAAGGSDRIADIAAEVLSGAATTANVVHHAKQIREASRKRALASAGATIVKEAGDGQARVGDLVDAAQARIMAIAEDARDGTLMPATGVAADVHNSADDAMRRGGKIDGLPTGLPRLDGLLLGLSPGDLAILAARPSLGKTALALNIADRTLRADAGLVIVYSLEMSRVDLVRRILASRSRVPAKAIRTGTLTADQWGKLTKAAGVFDNDHAGRLLIDDTGDVTPTRVRADLQRITARHKVALVLVDYLQLMSTAGKQKENRTQEVSAISRGLKQIARRFELPVLALSQLSRSIEHRADPIPVLSDLRESGSIEQDADKVVFIHRDLNAEDPEDRAITTIRVAKNRNGEIGTLTSAFRFAEETTTFYEITGRPQQWP